MGHGFYRVLGSFLLLTFLNSNIHGASLERFVGVLKHKDTGRSQLAQLDFVLSRNAGNQLEMSAVLKLHFGDFKRGEYVTYHFRKVIHFLLTQTFTFDEPSQPITIRKAQVKGDVFTGDMRTDFSSNVGTLVLTRQGRVKPETPLIESVSGEYIGKCDLWKKDAYRSAIQLYTYRNGGDSNSNAFGAYSVRGFVGRDEGDTCAYDPTNRMCIWSHIHGASYNFFEDELILYGKNKNYHCTVNETGLDCEGCFLTRVSSEREKPRQLQPLTSKPAFETQKKEDDPALIGSPSAIEGNYVGYVHHERLNIYQSASINILTYPEASGGGSSLKMSASAKLYFGDAKSKEVLPYRFKARNFPNPLLMGQFVFSGADEDLDAIIKVDKIGKGEISGVWYSRIFGRVGTFLVRKDEKVAVPKDALKLLPLSGRYNSKQYGLDFRVLLGSEPLSNQNPFYPLITEGKSIFLPLGGPARKIESGSFDFYTGKVSFQADSEIRKNVFVGERDKLGNLSLRSLSRGAITAIPPYGFARFARTGGAQ